MELAYCLNKDSNDYVKNLLESEIRYKEVCGDEIKHLVQIKIDWLKKECERRGVDVSL